MELNAYGDMGNYGGPVDRAHKSVSVAYMCIPVSPSVHQRTIVITQDWPCYPAEVLQVRRMNDHLFLFCFLLLLLDLAGLNMTSCFLASAIAVSRDSL